MFPLWGLLPIILIDSIILCKFASSFIPEASWGLSVFVSPHYLATCPASCKCSLECIADDLQPLLEPRVWEERVSRRGRLASLLTVFLKGEPSLPTHRNSAQSFSITGTCWEALGRLGPSLPHSVPLPVYVKPQLSCKLAPCNTEPGPAANSWGNRGVWWQIQKGRQVAGRAAKLSCK